MKLLNLLLIAAIALTSLGIAQAQYPPPQETYTAYSVTDVALNVAKPNNVYTATVHTVQGRATLPLNKAPMPSNGVVILIITAGCSHAPVAGETAIISNGPIGRSILFSGGATCQVVDIEIAGN